MRRIRVVPRYCVIRELSTGLVARYERGRRPATIVWNIAAVLFVVVRVGGSPCKSRLPLETMSRQVAQLQFHCGKPPPAADPKTSARIALDEEPRQAGALLQFSTDYR